MDTIDTSLSEHLRRQTRTAHEGVDQTIMAARPFDTLENYAGYLRVQHGLFSAVAPLYARADLTEVIADLAERNRLEALRCDLADLGETPPLEPASHLLHHQDGAYVLGWLYVVEGSNLGAAILLKHARGLGLDESHGARHLAAPPEGRAAYWRSFRAGLDAIDLVQATDPLMEARRNVVAGANAAFGYVRQLLRERL